MEEEMIGIEAEEMDSEMYNYIYGSGVDADGMRIDRGGE